MGHFFPLKYTDLLLKYAQMYDLDPYLVAAVINVESKYDISAQSHKDAKGLMQVTPTTGNWAAQMMGLTDFNEELLFNPEINIKIGCWYLNNLRQEFDSEDLKVETELMLAAYNGGSGNVRKWLQDENYSKDGTALDDIPFRETRQYVSKVLRHQKIYKFLYPDLSYKKSE
nr:lytic transglycosylase domain-containing protein [Oxobacter pfennigii]